VVDVWSRNVVAWDVAEREDAQISADLVCHVCRRERISKGRPSPVEAPRRQRQCLASGLSQSCGPQCWTAAWMSWMCSDPPGRDSASITPIRSRCSAPGKTRRLYTNAEEACAWVSSFVCFADRNRNSGEAVAISHHRARVDAQARQRPPRRWRRDTRCGRQPEVIQIKPPPPEKDTASPGAPGHPNTGIQFQN
jgi:hypothetical protein